MIRGRKWFFATRFIEAEFRFVEGFRREPSRS
jgi:hypothetical protein